MTGVVLLAGDGRAGWRTAVPVAVLVPASYGLVLLGLRHADVGVVAAARAASIPAAAVLGWWFLGERRTPRRVGGPCVVAVGVAVCGLAGS